MDFLTNNKLVIELFIGLQFCSPEESRFGRREKKRRQLNSEWRGCLKRSQCAVILFSIKPKAEFPPY